MKECSNYCTNALISHASKVMFKILQVRFQQYELQDVYAVYRNDKITRDQIANILWIVKEATELQKHICLCFIDYVKAFV